MKPSIRPARPLPIESQWDSEDEYVQSLLSFATSSEIFRNLCGGVHILDFLTRQPDLYSTVLPEEWRQWFDVVDLQEVLDFLLHPKDNEKTATKDNSHVDSKDRVPGPPQSLQDYVDTIRLHSLRRNFSPLSKNISPMPRHVSVGMKPKKIHEVTQFAAFVEELSENLSDSLDEPISIVDFGSGQNYLGRTLVCPPYHNHVIAIERKHHNINGAKGMDVHAKLAKKEKVLRNKKEYKRMLALKNGTLTFPENGKIFQTPAKDTVLEDESGNTLKIGYEKDSITYVEHDIEDGHLESMLHPLEQTPSQHVGQTANGASSVVSRSMSKKMVVSLHSCGNLSHHGLRSLILNTSVCAVAMIGCCYNLLTERLGPATYKHPQLRPNHPRLEATGSTRDIHGFPMSQTLENFTHQDGKGIRLNITARMMAVQAPHNWGPDDSEEFFRRHFYRALLQRILLDYGVVKQCSTPDDVAVAGGSLSGKDTSGTPLIVGTLRKACFANFRNYVRGALAKLVVDPVEGPMIASKTKHLSDEDIDKYESDWSYAKKNLSIVWSLMAFSAGVVESIITVDRWLYLREQDCVGDCWVQTVFDYKYSPRNLVVVGIKKA